MMYLNQYGLRYLLRLLKNYIYNFINNTTWNLEALIRGPIKEEIKEEIKNSINNNNIDQELLSLYFAEVDLSMDNRKIIYTSASSSPLSIDAGREIISESFNENTKEGIIIYDKAVMKINSITGGPVKILLPKTTKVLPPIASSDLIGIEGNGSLLSYDFDGAASLQYVMPKLLSIPNKAFRSCINLTSVTIGDSVTTIGDNAFDDCRSLTSVTIPDSVTKIGNYAFYYCNNLTSVNIPDSVTSIGDEAFCWCGSLTSVTIGDSVTTIGYEAFCVCSSLTSVTIPDSVTTIEDYAFYRCESLTSVYCKATTPPALGGTSVFDNNGSGRKIYVPMESVEAYKSAGYWSEYKSYIVGYDFD